MLLYIWGMPRLEFACDAGGLNEPCLQILMWRYFGCHRLPDVYRGVVAAGVFILAACGVRGECVSCRDCEPVLALKSNLAHDALLTPDLGVEICLARRFSVSASGVWAWWSDDDAHRYWRIYGGWVELRYWFGAAARRQAMTGHHAGIYGSMLSYDFEFGGKGWQSPGWTYGAGVSYGYSFRLNGCLNLDVGCRIGYSAGDVVTYRPQCGMYVCQSHRNVRYFGPTGLEVTLVWFPGKK